MPSSFDRFGLAPPAQPGLVRGFGLAVLAHGLLLLALTHGLQWKRDPQLVTAQAELWSALPQEAAPAAEPAPPPVPPAPNEAAPQSSALPNDAEIALERETEKRRAEQQAEQERAKRRQLALKEKREREAKQLAEQQREEAERKRKQQQDEVRLAKERAANLSRIKALADATGAGTSAGPAAQSAGPSASWAGRVQARVRPNIVFTESVSGNPKAEVEVRLAPDGTIIGKRILHSSGVKAWDEAVLRALDKTEVLPRDVDGRVPSPVVIEFRPRS